MEWIPLPHSLIPEKNGQLRKVKVAGKKICLIHEQGSLHATSARCPHAGADLSGGWCENGRLICPYHRRAFDLRSGRGDPGQGDYVTVYPLEKRGDAWFIGIRLGWFRRMFRK